MNHFLKLNRALDVSLLIRTYRQTIQILIAVVDLDHVGFISKESFSGEQRFVRLAVFSY